MRCAAPPRAYLFVMNESRKRIALMLEELDRTTDPKTRTRLCVTIIKLAGELATQRANASR